jgi:acetylornithine deacetylase/succinyl-diaminopimelate desuccinylase-like protein
MKAERSLAAAHACIDRVFDSVHLPRTQAFLRQPGISSEGVGLVESAGWLKEYLQELGAQVEFHGAAQAPIVLARFDLGRPKTLLVYSMYDVQPVAGQEWLSPPFAAEIHHLPGIGRSVIARGACNSKGPLASFLNALQAMQQADRIPVNLVLTIEGEEEIGSPGLPAFYAEHKSLLKADAGFEPFWAEYGTDVTRPTISLGSKGLVVLELACRGGDWGGPAEHPVHSSVGAWLGSPAWRLIQAIGTLASADESATIFDQDAAPPAPEDERLLAELAASFDEARTLALMGARRFKHPLHGADLLRKYLFSPSLHARLVEQGAEDVLPAEARAHLTVRLPPGIEARQTAAGLRRHFAAHGFGDIAVSILADYPASRTDLHSEVFQAMLAAYRHHGYEPQVLPLMASASPYYLFSQVLGIPYVWGGLGRAGGSHVPNEFATLEGLKLFEKSIATFLYEFGGGVR